MSPASPFITLQHASVRKGNKVVLSDLDWTIRTAEQWAIIGANGSGKTILAETLAGKTVLASGQITYHAHTAADEATTHSGIELVSADTLQPLVRKSARYYQQRYNSLDAESAPSVREILLDENAAAEDIQRMEHWTRLLDVTDLLDRRLIHLSNGETKRVLLTKALLRQPALLILDQPFIGLDVQAREVLKTLLNRIVQAGTQLLLVAAVEELPEAITHVLLLENGRIAGKYEKADFLRNAPKNPFPETLSSASGPLADRGLLFSPVEPAFRMAVRMQHVTVAYHGTNVLQAVNWSVMAGEKWALLGPNGSGKSTLLSLINGDNPQAYANDLVLFDRQRGSGESIWDIKRQIGFVSPELHIYYPPGISCLQVVASGHFDRMGEESTAFFRPYSPEQTERTEVCLRALDILPLRNLPFSGISTGEQRLVLLARALVKNPPFAYS